MSKIFQRPPGLLGSLVALLMATGIVSCAQSQQDDANGVIITEFLAANHSGIVDGFGNRSDWIELYNPGSATVNLKGYSLTDRRHLPRQWISPSISIPSQEYLLVFGVGQLADETSRDREGRLYANFRLATEGEYLALVSPSGTVLQEWDPGFPSQLADISYGRTPSGKEAYFPRPTPGEPNETRSFEGAVADVLLSHQRGFYDRPIHLRLSVATDGAVIRYSLDGSEPDAGRGTIYRQPITVDKTSILKVTASKPGYLPTATQTHSFLFLEDVAQQPAQPEGFPSDWGTDNEVPGRRVVADYGMDPRVVETTLPNYGIREALLDLPSLSVTMRPDDLFGRSRGIYTHPLSRGNAWEKVCSIEWIDPAGELNFQENCQIEIHGNSSRRPWRMQKHSFRLTFRESLGANRLEAPLFPGSAVERFNKLVLRASFTDSWGLVSWSPGRYRPNDSQYVRDVWMKESLRDMGHPSSHGRWVHLYLNGLYWGIYNVTERLDEDFFSDHLGGEPDDWEVIADFGRSSPGWARLFSVLRRAGADSISEPEVAALLDLNNFIDYMLLHFYADSEDWPHHNGYAARNAGADEPFRFFVWDQEIVLDNLRMQRYDSAHSNRPGELFQLLRRHSFFRTRFSDRVYFHLYGDGGLNLIDSQNRYTRVANEIDQAIVGESARWGDTQQSTPYGNRIQQPSNPSNTRDLRYPPAPHGPDFYFTREDSWIPERDNVIHNYLPAIYDATERNSLLQELRSQGLYPKHDPPMIAPPGGAAPSFRVQLIGPSGDAIYYTLDGTDPIGTAQVESIRTPLIHNETRVYYRVPTSTGPNRQWIQPDYAHLSWNSGKLAVGYETTPADYAPLIQSNVAAMRNETSSVYLRIPFHLDTNTLDERSKLILTMRYDDGFVAYLNGVRVADANAPRSLRWNTQATTSHADTEAIIPVHFDLSDHSDKLRTGKNVLALQGLNSSSTSSDLLLQPELFIEHAAEANTKNELNGRRYTGPFNLTESSTLKARSFRNGEWSALASARYFIGEAASHENLIISEIHYHPAGDEDSEYLALKNVHPVQPIDLSGIAFVDGIRFQFPPGAMLQSGVSGILVRSEKAYRNAFGNSHPVLGEYEGSLSNGGERLRVESSTGNILIDFEYDDTEPWPIAADGEGYSLVLIQSVDRPNPVEPGSWRSELPGPSTKLPRDGSADQDEDGLNALLEYALGTRDDDPQSGWNAIRYSVEKVASDGALSDYFFIHFSRDPNATEVVLVPEATAALNHGEWQSDQLTEMPESDALANWRSYRTRLPILPDSRVFVRLRVTLKD